MNDKVKAIKAKDDIKRKEEMIKSMGSDISNFKRYEMNEKTKKMVFKGILSSKVSEYLSLKYNLINVDKKTLYYYDGEVGIYRQDENGIKMETEIVSMFGDLATRYTVKEIMHILMRTKKIQISQKEMFEIFKYDGLICFKNGVYNVKTNEIQNHSPDVYFTKQIPVIYDPKAQCPMIKDAFDGIFEGVDDEWEWCGYCLTESNWLELISFYVGRGGTGKSTYFNLIESVFDRDYIANRDPHELTEDKYALSDLFGMSLCMSGDIGKDPIKNSHILKRASGRDPFSAERKYQHAFTMVNTAKFMYSCNEPPIINDKTGSMGRRMRYRYLNKQHETNDPFYLDKLTSENEKSGFINMALEGLKRLVERGGFKDKDDDPDEKMLKWDAFSKAIFTFVEDAFDVKDKYDKKNKDIFVYTDVIHEAFLAWCEYNGFPPLELENRNQFTVAFKNKMRSQGVKKRQINKHGFRSANAFDHISFSQMGMSAEWFKVEWLADVEEKEETEEEEIQRISDSLEF